MTCSEPNECGNAHSESHFKPDCREGEEIFKCADCREKYHHCMSASGDIRICRWCSGEDK